MLYILGGAARSGKSTIARRLVKENALPYFSTDAFINAIQTVDTLGIHHELPFIEKAEKIWPMVKSMTEGLIFDEPKYLFEGDGLLPKHIREIVDAHPDDVRACFVGYTQISVDEKLGFVRKYNDNKGDWTHNVTDEYLQDAIAEMINFSVYLKRECQENSIRFFDTSTNFNETLDEVIAYLDA